MYNKNVSITYIYGISGLFSNCIKITKIPDISNWNTSQVRNINNIFRGCKSLISIPDISKWNLKNLENKDYLISLFDSSTRSDNSSSNIFISSSNCFQSHSHSEISKNKETPSYSFYENTSDINTGETFCESNDNI